VPTPPPVTRADHELARELATRAGELLVALRADLHAAEAPPASVRDEGDRRSHRYLVDALAEARPGDAVLSEESGHESVEERARRVASRRTWIVDPLDGTREFGEVGRTDWAVHVALCLDGEPVVGAVALPALGRTLDTLAPPAAPPAPARPRVVVSRSRPPAAALRIAEALDAELVEMGSAGAKAMSVLAGDADVYPHSGGQYEWDSCAPVAVARAAGMWCSRLDGGRLAYNQADPYLPDLLICRPELAGPAIRAAEHHR